MRIALAVLLAMSSVPAWSSIPTAKTPIPAPVVQLTPKAVFELIVQHRRKQDLVVIDIRSPDAYAKGHLPGAVNIEYDAKTFAKDFGNLDRSKSYVLTCGGGKTSGIAASEMAKLGYTPIYNMEGGISAWTAFGLATAK